jgi:hypothetical protein
MVSNLSFDFSFFYSDSCMGFFCWLKTVEDYRKRLNADLLKNGHDVNVRFPDGYQEAPLAYDAVWAVALGKNLSASFPFISMLFFLCMSIQFLNLLHFS